MKKIMLSVLLVAVLAFAGCGANDVDNTSVAALPQITSASEWVTVLSTTVPFEDQMTLVEPDTAKNRYGTDDAYTGDCAMYISSMATPEEIAVFETNDVFDAAYFTALAESFLAAQKESYTDYAPEQVPKLDTAVVRECGTYVVVCVSADNEKAASVIDAYIGK